MATTDDPRLIDGTFGRIGIAGVALGTAVAVTAAGVGGADPADQVAIALCACGTFIVLTLARRSLTGRASLTYYHHEIAILLASAALGAALGAPVLVHLDATAAGLGTFLAVGRIGCWRVGCCHGRPTSRGITYRNAVPALPPYLRGVPLAPVQLFEAALVAALVAAALLLLSADQPGRALVLYVTGYSLVRPFLEELRGDWQRPWWRGLSEAQWTSVVLIATVSALEVAGALPFGWWTIAAPAVIAAEIGLLVAFRRRREDLLGPRHLREIVRAGSEPAGTLPRVFVTSEGLRISPGATGPAQHVTFSRPGRPLEPADARALAAVIASECLWTMDAEVVVGAAGAVHVVARNSH